MPLKVVANDKEFYGEYTNTLRESAKIPVSVYSDSAGRQPRIEGALQEFFASEVVKLGHDALRAGGVSSDLLDESDLRSSLEGVPLPPEDQRILEAKLRLFAGQVMLPNTDGGGGPEPPEDSADGTQSPRHRVGTGVIKQAVHNSGDTCICMATGIPGDVQSLTSLKPLPSPPPGQPLTIAVFLFHPGFILTISDVLNLLVEPVLRLALDQTRCKLVLRPRLAGLRRSCPGVSVEDGWHRSINPRRTQRLTICCSNTAAAERIRLSLGNHRRSGGGTTWPT
jgi:hypothetical protein